MKNLVSMAKSFMRSEKGDTNFISIIIIVAIVIALAGVFYTMASGGMDLISQKFTEFIESLG